MGGYKFFLFENFNNKLIIKFSFLLLCFSITTTAQISGAWTASGSGATTSWSATAGTINITATATNYGESANPNNPTNTLNDFQTTGEMLACVGAYSDPALVNNPSLSIRHTFPNSAFITFTFSKNVINPIINIDRLGGGGGPGDTTTSSLLRVVDPGITLTQLSANGTHFVTDEVNRTITRQSGISPYNNTTPECGAPVDATAAGSVRLNGNFNTITFEILMNPDQSSTVNDRFEIAFSSMVPDSDGDGVPDASDKCNGFNDALDNDNDTVPDSCDLDDDNDGILDTVELRCDQPNAANSNFGTGTLQDQLYFFNWTNAVFNDGIHVGDSQTFNIGTGADILQVVATVTAVSGVGGDYLPTDMATWVNGAFAKAYNTPGNREAFYGGIGDSIDVTITFVGTKNGMPYPLDLLAFDPESTGPGEQIIYTTNGENWEFVEVIETRGGTNGTYTVSDQTLTATETYVTGSSLYVSNNASEIRTQAFASGGREGIAYGLFLRCDTDNDGIPNSSDTDSDNDGCPDAVEAAGSFLPTQLTTLAGGSNGAGSSLLNFGTTVNTTQGSANFGVPTQDANGLAIATNMPQATATAVTSTAINACQADLSLTKRVDKAIVKVGDTIIYTLTLKNDGSGNATGVQVTDVLPTGITYVSDNSATTSTTYTGNVWNVGNLNVNQTKSLQITATVSGVGAIVNTVQVTQSNQTDPDSTPNNGS